MPIRGTTYGVPAANLRERDTNLLAEQAASNNVTWLGQRGGEANGFEGDSNSLCDPGDLQTHGFIRDPRILWPDSASIAADGYLYMNINQLPYQPMWNNGIDLTVHPGAILRARLPRNGTKINSLAKSKIKHISTTRSDVPVCIFGFNDAFADMILLISQRPP